MLFFFAFQYLFAIKQNIIVSFCNKKIANTPLIIRRNNSVNPKQHNPHTN